MTSHAKTPRPQRLKHGGEIPVALLKVPSQPTSTTVGEPTDPKIKRVWPTNRPRLSMKTTCSVLFLFHAAVPDLEQFLRRRDDERANHTNAQPLRVGVIPDALGQLRVLLFPRLVG